MELLDWHTNAINSIKCAVIAQLPTRCYSSHSLLGRYHPTRPDLIMTCGFDQIVKVTCCSA
jgi:hypothetical protein